MGDFPMFGLDMTKRAMNEQERKEFVDMLCEASDRADGYVAVFLKQAADEIERLGKELYCPIGLDHNRGLCSAGTCKQCLWDKIERLLKRVEELEKLGENLEAELHEQWCCAIEDGATPSSHS